MSSLKWAHSSVLVMTLDGEIKGEDQDEKVVGTWAIPGESRDQRRGFAPARLCNMNGSEISTKFEQNATRAAAAAGVSRHFSFDLQIRIIASKNVQQTKPHGQSQKDRREAGWLDYELKVILAPPDGHLRVGIFFF